MVSDGGLYEGAGFGNDITGNSIFDNGSLGIDLGDDGVTPNHATEPTAANQYQNYPVLTSAVSSGGVTTIMGNTRTRTPTPRSRSTSIPTRPSTSPASARARPTSPRTRERPAQRRGQFHNHDQPVARRSVSDGHRACQLQRGQRCRQQHLGVRPGHPDHGGHAQPAAGRIGQPGHHGLGHVRHDPGRHVFHLHLPDHQQRPQPGAEGVSLSDTLNSAVTFLSGTATTGNVTSNGSSVAAELGNLAVGATARLPSPFWRKPQRLRSRSTTWPPP